MKVKELIAATQWHPSPRYGADRPRVSVLLPTFCRGKSGMLMRSARSVLGQSLADLELVIVDDASTDGSADQIRQLMAEDDRVSCLRHPRNVGLPAVSEYEAFLKARAEYLAFAFDDDEFYEDALADLLAAITAGDHSIVHGTVEMFIYDPILRRKARACLGRQENGQSLLRATNYIPNNAVMVHRRVVQAVGFYDPHVALSRQCDWDLWRRAARCFPIVPLDICVGRVSGPAMTDSLGHTRLLDQWQSAEWVDLPRNEQLKPGTMEEYDVLAVPGGLSRSAALAVEEMGETFRDKFWFPKSPPAAGHGWLADGDRWGNGRLLVVTPAHAASATSCFNRLPTQLRGRVRIACSAADREEEMIGASAVVFTSSAPAMAPWIDYAERIGVPCYCFLDDDFLAPNGQASGRPQPRRCSADALRERLRGFAGVLLSSRRLIDYFREEQLHSNLLYYPPLRHFDGQQNLDVLRAILEAHPVPGPTLREMRWRRAIHFVRDGFAARWCRELPRKVAGRVARKLLDFWPGRSIE
ncbi:MAG: glycosyltransferase family 2 protein [Thermoguttaceae bacterium]